MADRPGGRARGVVRDAAGDADAGAQDGPLGGTRLQQFAEERAGEYRAVAVKGRAAAEWIAVDRDRGSDPGSRGARSDGGSRTFFGRDYAGNRSGAVDRDSPRRGDLPRCRSNLD